MNDVSTLLRDPTVRRAAERTVRRAIPPCDAEDVVQAVYCGALEASSWPHTHSDAIGWLVGIARHKVADYFRAARRQRTAPLPEDMPTCPTDFESRDTLKRLLRGHEDGRARETLAWLVREHEGESCVQMAEEAHTSHAAIRQRMSRHRRWLRREWAYLLGATLLAFGGSSAYREARECGAIHADDGSVVGAPSWATGTFEVEQAALDPSVDSVHVTLFESLAKGARLTVSGRDVLVSMPTGTARRTIQAATNDGDETVFIVSNDAGVKSELRVHTLDAARIRIAAREGIFTLRRVR